MDVRAKQRLSFGVVRLTQAGLAAVSPHVISAVGRLLVKSNGAKNDNCVTCKYERGNYHSEI